MGVLQYFDNFFEDKPKNETLPRVGDIWWVPTMEVGEVPRVFEASRVAPQGHEITEFIIKEITQQHFTKRDRLPIKVLSLKETEELVIAKAKKRPVIVLASSCASDVCESCGRRLHEEPLAVLLSQFAHLLGEVGSEAFQLVKELVAESYPSY